MAMVPGLHGGKRHELRVFFTPAQVQAGIAKRQRELAKEEAKKVAEVEFAEKAVRVEAQTRSRGKGRALVEKKEEHEALFELRHALSGLEAIQYHINELDAWAAFLERGKEPTVNKTPHTKEWPLTFDDALYFGLIERKPVR